VEHHRCHDLAPKIQAPSPLPANSVSTAFLRTPSFNQLCLKPRDFDLDMASGGGIEEALEAAMALHGEHEIDISLDRLIEQIERDANSLPCP
jgi:hypothetical protein